MASYSFPNGLLSRLVSEMSAAVSFSGFLRQSRCSACGLNRLPSRRCTRSARLACSVRRQMLPANVRSMVRLIPMHLALVGILSNSEWVTHFSSVWYKKDFLIVAGDVAETYDNFVVTGTMTFGCVDKIGSLEKLNSLLEACSELGVQTSPKIVVRCFHGITRVLTKRDVNGIRIPSLKMILHMTRYPRIFARASGIINMQELCPEKRMLFYPNLPKIIGSDFLEARIRSIHGQEASGSGCHVFGHTHFSWDSVIDGIRYVQASLTYPRERSARKRRMDSADDYWLPFCIYHNGFTDRLAPSYWSDYYSKNKRDPENTDLAPWVARFYRR